MKYRILIERSAKSEYGPLSVYLTDHRTGEVREFDTYESAYEYTREIMTVPAPATITYRVVEAP